MRTRTEIQDEFREMVVPEPGDAWRVQLELLLDIRELLWNQAKEHMEEKVAKAREEEEKTRQAAVATKLQDLKKGGEDANL